MLAVNIPNNLHELLNEVKGHFQENLKRNFIDECTRRHQRNRNHEFDISKASISDDNGNIELNNLRITEESPCVLNTFILDLEMFNIILEVNIQHLKIYGEYKHSTENTLKPISKSGNIIFTLDDTNFYANVGIAIKEDSFITTNYDINFKPAKISTEISVQNETEGSSSAEIDKTLVKHLSAQLKTFFHWEILHQLLAGSIVEYSVSELLIDEPEEMIAISAERALKANEMMDSLLNTMNEFFRSSNQTILEMPSIKFDIVNGKICTKFQSDKGQLQDLSTFVRYNDMSFYKHQGVLYLYGLIKLSNFKLKYTSCKIADTSEKNGNIEVQIYRGTIFVKLAITNDENSVNVSVNKVETADLRDITINSDELKDYYDQLYSRIVGSLYSVVFPLLENKISEGLQHAIQKRKA